MTLNLAYKSSDYVDQFNRWSRNIYSIYLCLWISMFFVNGVTSAQTLWFSTCHHVFLMKFQFGSPSQRDPETRSWVLGWWRSSNRMMSPQVSSFPPIMSLIKYTMYKGNWTEFCILLRWILFHFVLKY